MRNRKLVALSFIGAAALLAAGGAFAVAVWSGEDESAIAAEPLPSPGGTLTPDPTPGEPVGGGSPEHPGDDVTPEPGATPDPSQPWWYVPWLNAERGKPTFDGVLAGIRIADGLSTPTFACAGDRAVVELERADGTNVDSTPEYLPFGTELLDGDASVCDGTAFSSQARYSVPADPETGRLGGQILIYRRVGEPIAAVAVASERWSESRIAGEVVALATPILPELGLGSSAVVHYGDGVVTVVHGLSIELDELLAVAGSVLEL